MGLDFAVAVAAEKVVVDIDFVIVAAVQDIAVEDIAGEFVEEFVMLADNTNFDLVFVDNLNDDDGKAMGD